MIPVIYSEKMVGSAQSFSPSSIKPQLVVEGWITGGYPISLPEPEKIKLSKLYAVHSKSYVDDVLSMKLKNGFGTKDQKTAESLLYTTGAMIQAVDLCSTEPVVCVPVSGFHHAGYDYGGGFCTFNGLMAAAVHADRRVLILDCDFHYGDGTEDILTVQPNTRITHSTFGRRFHSPMYATKYMVELMRVCADVIPTVDLVIYQAGADVHRDDPLGGVLTTQQMARRDRMVFEACKKAGIPVIWNLAGGYQEPVDKVLALHDNTMRECMGVFIPHTQ